MGKSCSTESICHTAVPQGSVLGPILFSLYISQISSIANKHGITQQQYADDTQLYIAVSNSDHTREIQRLEACLLAIHAWFYSHGLALNPNKTDTIVFGTHRSRRQR